MEKVLGKQDLVLRDRVVDWLAKYPWTWTWMVTYGKMEKRLAQGKTSAAHWVPGYGWSGGGKNKGKPTARGTTQSAAKKIFERYMKREMPDFSWFYVVEPNPKRDGHHIHALLIPPGGKGVEVAKHGSAWGHQMGWNTLEPIRSKSDIERYCTKHICFYLTKGAGWYNIEINDSEIFHAAQ